MGTAHKRTIKDFTSQRAKEQYKDFLCVLPALVFLGIFVFYPILDFVRISFTNWNLLKDEYSYVYFKNYQWLFFGTGFKDLINSLVVTFKYTFFEVFITIFGGMLLAVIFNSDAKPFGAMRSIVFIPKYVAMATASVVFMWILHPSFGILNMTLAKFGVSPIDWLNSEKHAMYGILMLTCWRAVGYSMMLYLSAIRGISQDYFEAAGLDGANALQKFRHITLPMLSPITLFIFLTTFISAMKIFQSIDVMTKGGPYKATNVMVYWVYDLAFINYRVDRAAAVTTIFFIILLIFTVLTMKVSDKHVHYDA